MGDLNMGKLRLTVVREWEPDLDNYKSVEWPAGTPARDLTDIEEIMAYEQSLYDGGNTSIDEILNVDDSDAYRVKWEVVSEAQIMEPAELPTAGEQNPFLDAQKLPDDQLDKVADCVKDGLEADRADAGAKAEAGSVAAESDEDYVEREAARRRRVEDVNNPSLG